MHDVHNHPCSHNFVTDDIENEPELATNDDWRSMMTRARKDHGLSQEDLAAEFGVSQAIISKLESGTTASSKLIRPICRRLSIPLPEHYVDEDERDWILLGRALRHRDIEAAKKWYDLIRSTVDDLEHRAAGSRELPKPGRK